MTARLIEINHRQRKSAFHCPLTGVRVWEDGEETFETCTTSYFLFLMTPEGRLFSRTDDGLPIGHRKALNLVIDELESARPSVDEMQTFMPNVIAGLLPDSVALFELRSPQARRHDEPATWIAMDFGLPEAEVGPSVIDNTVTLPEPV